MRFLSITCQNGVTPPRYICDRGHSFDYGGGSGPLRYKDEQRRRRMDDYEDNMDVVIAGEDEFF